MRSTVDSSSVKMDTILRPFPHQVGGHFGIFLFEDNHVVKELDICETEFYEHAPEILKPFLPDYCGIVDVRAESVDRKFQLKSEDPMHCIHECFSSPMEISTSAAKDTEKSLSEPNWGNRAQNKTTNRCVDDGIRPFFLMTNEVARFRKPNVMDMKIGTRQHGDRAPEDKKKRHQLKNVSTTSPLHGLRLVGYKMYSRENGGYMAITKDIGKGLDHHDLSEHIRKFLKNAGMRRAESMEAKLKALIRVIKQLDSYRFYGSSLLIAYEGDSSVEEEDEITVKVIDFSHISFAGFKECDESYVLYGGPDSGMILGLENLLQEVSGFVARCSSL